MLIVYYSPIIHRLVTTEKILKKAVTKKKRKRYSRKSWESRKKPKKTVLRDKTVALPFEEAQ